MINHIPSRVNPDTNAWCCGKCRAELAYPNSVDDEPVLMLRNFVLHGGLYLRPNKIRAWRDKEEEQKARTAAKEQRHNWNVCHTAAPPDEQRMMDRMVADGVVTFGPGPSPRRGSYKSVVALVPPSEWPIFVECPNCKLNNKITGTPRS